MALTKELENCESLQNKFNSILLSTVNTYNEPHTSYAPYVKREGCFYIFVSTLAEHTINMLNNPIASIMFIEDEANTRNIYARERAIVKVNVSELAEESSLKESILKQMEDEQGKTINMLRELSDFKMLKLQPVHGRYVVGFGKAYDWDVLNNKMTHVSS